MSYIELLKQKLGENKVLLNEPMSKHTSFKVGGNADVFVKVNNVQDLQYIINLVKDNKLSLFILGNGSNILVSDKGIKGIVCKIDINKFEVEEKEDNVFVTCRKWKQKWRDFAKTTRLRNNRF